MLQVKIKQGYPDGSLDLDYVGSTCRNKACVDKGWAVHWIVNGDSGVKYIADIAKKTGHGDPPSTDGFWSENPRTQGSASTHWKGTVSPTAPDNAVYNYNIFWADESGQTLRCDPKIAVNPTRSDEFLLSTRTLAVLMGIGLGILGVSLFLTLQRKHREGRTRRSVLPRTGVVDSL